MEVVYHFFYPHCIRRNVASITTIYVTSYVAVGRRVHICCPGGQIVLRSIDKCILIHMLIFSCVAAGNSCIYAISVAIIIISIAIIPAAAIVYTVFRYRLAAFCHHHISVITNIFCCPFHFCNFSVFGGNSGGLACALV